MGEKVGSRPSLSQYMGEKVGSRPSLSQYMGEKVGPRPSLSQGRRLGLDPLSRRGEGWV